MVVRGKVEKFARLSPRRLRLTGLAGEEIGGTVEVQPEGTHDFKILSARAYRGDNIQVQLDPPPAKDKPYQLKVKNTRTTPGRYFDRVILQTDSKLRPEIKVSVYGNILEKK
jgi:hypothetical protein